MANPKHVKVLKQGVAVWNEWREENPNIKPDLSLAHFSNSDFQGIDLSKTNLHGADLNHSNFHEAYLCEANLSLTNLSVVDFFEADLTRVNLTKADGYKTDFSEAWLVEADLSESYFLEAIFTNARLNGSVIRNANLQNSVLTGVDFSNATIIDSRVYGISAWDIKKEGLIQKGLIITKDRDKRPEITVDDIEVAQFIYLLLHNQNIRNIIDTITSKTVLILGRFTPERKAVLEALKDELRQRNYLPIVFDFQNPSGKSVDETINLLARISRFVIADITDAKSIPQELRGIVPDNPSIPVVPLILKGQREYGMFDHFRRYPWVLPLHEYESPETLLREIITAIITPAEEKVTELRGKMA